MYPSSVVTKSSLLTFGFVAGSESVSAFFSVVIVLLSSASYASDIHATFVNILSSLPALAVTSHFIWIVSESNVAPPSYADNLSTFDVLFFFYKLSL